MASLKEISTSIGMFLFILQLQMIRLAAGSDAKVSQFDVKPGGVVHEYEMTLEGSAGFKCKFIFSCQGGTKENWEMTLSQDKSTNQMSCLIERPSGVSYLFFEQFRVEISGATIQDAQVHGDSSASLKQEEYKIDQSANAVYQDKKFNNKLAGLMVIASTGKGEL